MAKKLLEHFMKRNCKKTNQKEFRIEKRENVINYMSNGNAMKIRPITGLMKKTLYKGIIFS